MIACIGYITPEYFKFPGYLSPTSEIEFADVPNGLGAFSTVPALGWAQMFLFVGLVETGFYRADPSRGPGDFKKASPAQHGGTGLCTRIRPSGPQRHAEPKPRRG